MAFRNTDTFAKHIYRISTKNNHTMGSVHNES